jgi:hypothetical protein
VSIYNPLTDLPLFNFFFIPFFPEAIMHDFEAGMSPFADMDGRFDEGLAAYTCFLRLLGLLFFFFPSKAHV